MTGESRVLIISTVADMATDDVVKRLSSRGIPHNRLNTEDYPFSQTLTYRRVAAPYVAEREVGAAQTGLLGMTDGGYSKTVCMGCMEVTGCSSFQPWSAS